MTAPAPVAPAAPGRRRMFVGAGAAALAAGAGIAWWSQRAGSGADPAIANLWALRCEQPDGSSLALADFRGHPLLVNFWATWCPPCVEELPMIDGFFAQRGGNAMQVLGLAVDKAASVRTFLARTPVKFPVGITGMEGLALLRTLGNTGGGLPFTLVLSASGGIHARKMGQISLQELQGWAREV